MSIVEVSLSAYQLKVITNEQGKFSIVGTATQTSEKNGEIIPNLLKIGNRIDSEYGNDGTTKMANGIYQSGRVPIFVADPISMQNLKYEK